MDDRTAERIDRYDEYAEKARARAEAAQRSADQYSARFQGGQPILVGHHSAPGARRDRDRSDAAMRRAIKAEDAAKYWKRKAHSAARRDSQKHDPGVIQRRIKRLEAEQRQINRLKGEAKDDGNRGHAAQLDARAGEVAEQLAQNRAELAESGAKQWGKADFAKGDYAYRGGTWWEIKRVNAKTVTVGSIIGSTHARARLAGKPVYRLSDNPYGWTDTVPYTEVTGRIPGRDMNAKLS